MDKTTQPKRLPVINICGKLLVVQPYGGGVRYHCPACDIRPGFKFNTISWTNGSPSTQRFCNNGKKG